MKTNTNFRYYLATVKNVMDKSCRETRKTDFMFNNSFFENRAV
jgi:hypothetical protein